MKEYYVAIGTPVTPDNAMRTFDNQEESVQYAEDVKKEILEGVYDAEWDINPEERGMYADDISVYGVEYSRAGAIQKNWKIA